jgi:predicted exporter
VLVAGLVAAIVVVGFWRPWATPAATVDDAPAAPPVMSLASAHARWVAGLASS